MTIFSFLNMVTVLSALAQLLLSITFIPMVYSFQTRIRSQKLNEVLGMAFHRKRSVLMRLHGKEDDELVDNNDDDGILDWRDFRAKLVMSQKKELDEQVIPGVSTENGEWVYESGHVIEKGSIILSRPEQDFGHGLSQQYFHKCVILVISHEENLFTRGIILNRPTDLVLSDDDFMKDDGTPLDNSSSQNTWPVYFGGDVRGITSEEPDIMCLHTLTSEAISKVSTRIMKDLQYTTFEDARTLVNTGHASTTDFWVFIGYAGWGSGQLLDELTRESWFMIATDSQTVLKEISFNKKSYDPRGAGIDTWATLMYKIDKHYIVDGSEESFEDFMLREWAKENLIFHNNITQSLPQAKEEHQLPQGIIIDNTFTNNLMTSILNHNQNTLTIEPGTFLRATCNAQQGSPFLLDEQYFHKSILLVISETDEYTLAAILNIPSTQDIKKFISTSPSSIKFKVPPVRFGGKYSSNADYQSNNKDSFLLWLHYNQKLRDANIGSPLNNNDNKYSSQKQQNNNNNDVVVWRCSQEQAINAIKRGIAHPTDFIIVEKFSVWPMQQIQLQDGTLLDMGDDDTNIIDGLQAEVIAGNYEIVPSNQIQGIWDLLLTQISLSSKSIDKNIQIADNTWNFGRENNVIHDESNDDHCVFQTDVKVSELADDALRCWIATVLLGDTTLRRRYSALE